MGTEGPNQRFISSISSGRGMAQRNTSMIHFVGFVPFIVPRMDGFAARRTVAAARRDSALQYDTISLSLSLLTNSSTTQTKIDQERTERIQNTPNQNNNSYLKYNMYTTISANLRMCSILSNKNHMLATTITRNDAQYWLT
jgi:hypothetical protein